MINTQHELTSLFLWKTLYRIYFVIADFTCFLALFLSSPPPTSSKMVRPRMFQITAWLEYLEHLADQYDEGDLGVGYEGNRYEPEFSDTIIGTTNDGLMKAFDLLTISRKKLDP